MRVIISSSGSWCDERAVVDAVCELPPATTVLLPTNKGACAIIRQKADELKLDIEDWSMDDESYEQHWSQVNADMFETDVDMCIAFLTSDAYMTKDCIRRARNMFLDTRIVTS